MKLRFLWQQAQQIGGLIYAAVRYDNKFPDKNTYSGQIQYSLPFNGKWVVANGGVDEQTSHSWDIYPQRYAYDFLILDDEARSFLGDEKNLNSYYCYGKDVIARCGNSGNISEPHIHFQVQNTKRFYSSIGLPIRFASVRKSLALGYEKADPRPIPDYGNLDDANIVRGLIVENIT